jgi:hypothetical protein
MSASVTLRRLRTFLFVLAAALFAGTVVELILAEHTDEPLQLIPFALCGLGLSMLAVAWKRPGRGSVLALRAVMVIVAAGSLLGMWEHYEGNRGFALEVHPDAGGTGLIRSALTGADPLLAPGILAIAAAVAVAATYATATESADALPQASDEPAAGDRDPAPHRRARVVHLQR